MKKLVLHIGMPKTGTTTLQFALDSNRKTLLANGVLYPKSGMSESEHKKGHHELVDALRANRLEVFNELGREVAKSDAHTAVISSEEFVTLGRAEIESAQLALSGFEVKVLVYLREQAGFLESLYNQAVKTGTEVRDRTRFLADMLSSNRLNYYSLVKRWANVFGSENVQVRLYGVNNKSDCLVDEFLDAVGLGGLVLSAASKNYNHSVDSKYIEFLRVVNKLGLNQEIKNKKIVSLLLSDDSRRGTSGLSIYGNAERSLVRNYCRASNRMLAKEYLGDENGELFPISKEEPVVVPESISPELLAEVVSLFMMRD